MEAKDRFEVLEKVIEIINFAIKEKVTGSLKVSVDTEGNVDASFEAEDFGGSDNA